MVTFVEVLANTKHTHSPPNKATSNHSSYQKTVFLSILISLNETSTCIKDIKLLTGNILQMTCNTFLCGGLLKYPTVKVLYLYDKPINAHLKINMFNHVTLHQHVTSCDHNHSVSNKNTINIQIYVHCLHFL
jgi:hypothetical protein